MDIAQTDDLRKALSHYATSVAVITIWDDKDDAGDKNDADDAGDADIYGLTINSFVSVSLKPALILWCLGTDAVAFKHFSQKTHFGVSVLGAHQKDISHHYARHAEHRVRSAHQITRKGYFFIKDSIAHIGCQTYQHIEMGDHLMIIGKVDFLWIAEAQTAPLIFYQSSYQSLNL